MADERVRRRLAAILAADIVGYSRLMDADETGTLERLKSLRDEIFDPKVAKYGGRIFKLTGDGALAEFGSSVDAVQAAVEVQRALEERNAALAAEERLNLRIGISLGDVIVEGDDLYGNGVNVAARLEAIAEPGGVCISGNVQEHARGVEGIEFEDLGEQQVKNIDRPIQAYRVILEPGIAPTQSTAKTRRRSFHGPRAIAAAIVLVAAIAGIGIWQPWQGSSGRPEQLSIVVLPFDNLSGDKSQDYLADVVTDQLTTYLSRIPSTFVIARNTAFTFKGKPVDVKKLGRDLGVRYVLEGSVQPAGDRIRVNSQLIDTETGAHLWAEKFDRSLTERFRMQDEIVARVSRALHIQLSEVEAARLSVPNDSNPEANSLAIRCEAIFLRWGPARKQTQEGYKLCEQALRRDATNVQALSLLAIRHGFRVATGQSDDRPGDIKRSAELAERAIAANPNYYMARYAKAVAHSVRGEHQETIIEAKDALALNPSFVTAYMFMLAAGVYTGQPEKTIEWAAMATRISPRDPLVSAFIAFTGRAYFMQGKDELAVKWLRDSVIRNPRFPQNRIFLAGVLGASGREAEASEVLKVYLSLKRTRSKTIEQWKRELRTDNPLYVAAFNRLTEGLRKAGMPEN